jgi:hypothetical protein
MAANVVMAIGRIRFFNRGGHFDSHPLCRPISRVQVNANSGETDLRKKCDRQPKAAGRSCNSEDGKKRKEGT